MFWSIQSGQLKSTPNGTQHLEVMGVSRVVKDGGVIQPQQ